MIPIRRGGGAHSLVVGMTGAKMGDRVAQIGCAHAGRLGAIAAPVGLSGRAVAIVPDDASAERARKGAAQAGVLVDVEVAPPTRIPLDNDAFDLVVIDDTGGLLATMPAEDRVAAIREALRIQRPGGRVMVVGTIPRGGLGALFSRAQSGPSFDPAPALQADGFKSVRTLAEREGLRFTEGIKPRA
jgi:ubiquinone/menaquinone biosynthesis C-methylase UbiE